MKKLLLSALWACLVLPSGTKAHTYTDDEKSEDHYLYKDTIRIEPSDEIAIILIGKNSTDLDRYRNADSLKNLFLADMEKAVSNPTFSKNSRKTYYFVHSNGKRRMKAENEEYTEQEINIEKEKREMGMGLPPYEFTIYDFKNDYEMHFYLKSPDDLIKISGVKIKDALGAALENKQVIRQSTRIEIVKTNEHWIIKDHNRDKTDLLELSPAFGMSLIGSRWSPTAAFNLSLIFDNKYGIPFIKTGLSYGVNSFADWSAEQFSNLNIVASYDLKFMSNISDNKPKWIGLQGGFMKSYEKSGPLHNKWKAGIVAEGFGAFNFGFDVIFLKEKKSVYSLTLKVPF